MSKLKQSIAILRQIPEHIRDNYPVFVEFLRVYYKFLEETQQQDLENLHDIDLVTEEFIDRFKGELSRNFPIHLVSDKRLVLKHLREFYLSRGSEDSYKFLFRTIFGKEASLYYPSKQILRVSDGRWVQDVSIFIQPTNGILDASEIVGQFIYIENSKGKIIRTFVRSVVKYSEEISEVFIDRDYANEINVGGIVTCETSNYKGIILPCPSSVKVFKGGKGFAAGEIYALKTQLGRGCVIKITKVDSNGTIQRIQVIRFGLDYKTKFYSYLSSTEDTAWEYIHPLKIGAGASDTKTYDVVTPGTNTFAVNYIIETGTPLLLVEVIRNGTLVTLPYTATNGTSVTIDNLQTNDIVKLFGILSKGVVPGIADPAYNENSNGFADYGWASKQTYFYYDTDIPVSDEAWASDRYFADSSYVGDVVQQFYNDVTQKGVDDELAIIEIDIGAVAKYPGYYSTADGFISDEMYIQDGEYYQAFSYVIRVEEELRRYADIVKALVHPVGMKVFSEYNIYNELKLSSSQPRSFLSLTLPLYDHPSTSAIPDDRGIGYTSYDSQFLNGELIITASEDSSAVYAGQGKASLMPIKKLFDMVSSSDSLNEKYVQKNVTEVISERFIQIATSDPTWLFTRSYDETISKSVSKNISDQLSEYISQAAKLIEKNLLEVILQSDAYEFAIEKLHIEFQSITDNYAKLVEKNVQDVIASQEDNDIKGIDLLKDEFINYVEAYPKAFSRILEDTQIIDENYLNHLSKRFASTITSPTDGAYRIVDKVLTDALSSITDNRQKFDIGKLINEDQFTPDNIGKASSRKLSDSINTSMSGNIVLNPFNLEGYFLENYVPSTLIN